MPTDDEKIIINRIQKYLKLIGDENRKNIKIILICNLFIYLNENTDFINSYPRFKNTVINKYNQLKSEIYDKSVNENVRNRYITISNKLFNSL